MDRDPTTESLLRDGRQAYSSRRYKQAAKCFTLALKRCSCAKETKRERCACKNFIRAAESNSSVFEEALKACQCSVGRSFGTCDNALHIQALDYRAAAFEVLEAIDRARNDAEWMLELAPHSPLGYLRLGKVLRVEKKKRLAWKVFNAGIEAGLSVGLSPTETNMKKLYDARRPLQARYACLSPLDLPVELIHHIFAFLEIPDLMVCTRVCKQWRAVMTSPINCHLWRTFEYPQYLPIRQTLPSARVLKKYLGWSGNDVRTIIVRDVPPRQDLDAWLKTLIRGAPRLKHLEIHRGFDWGRANALERAARAWPKSITKLILGGLDGREEYELPLPDLSHLELRGACSLPPGSFINLRYLSLSSSAAIWNLPASNTPNLEQLKIRVSDIFSDREDSFGNLESWAKLKVLIFRSAVWSDTALCLLHRLCTHNDGNGLLHLEIAMGGRGGLNTRDLGLQHRLPEAEYLAHIATGNWANSQEPPTAFSDLRALKTNPFATEPDSAQNLIRRSQEKGTLLEFDINFEALGLDDSGRQHFDFLETFGWLRGAGSIQRLGIRYFHFDMYSDKQVHSLPEFLGTFPNLQTLLIQTEHHTSVQLSLIILKIMKSCSGLRIVYAPDLMGTALDNVRREGRDSYGVRIVPADEPKPWPVPI